MNKCFYIPHTLTFSKIVNLRYIVRIGDGLSNMGIDKYDKKQKETFIYQISPILPHIRSPWCTHCRGQYAEG